MFFILVKRGAGTAEKKSLILSRRSKHIFTNISEEGHIFLGKLKECLYECDVIPQGSWTLGLSQAKP